MMIGRSILNHIQTGKVAGYNNAQQAMMAWGAQKFIANDVADGYGLGWLRFRVDGSEFQGWVRVALNGQKTYNITFEAYNNKTGESGIVGRKNDVLAEDIANVIDKVVEGIDAEPDIPFDG